MLKLAEAGAAILMLSPRHSRRVALVLGPTHNEAGIRIAQVQRLADPDFCLRVSTALVRKKIGRQAALLEQGLTHRPDQRLGLVRALREIGSVQQRLDGNERDLAALRGYEGAAARSFFQGFATLFPPALNFHGRNRRPPRDPVNATLSLAYTLLHFDAVRAAHVAGLDPLIGFYHRPAYGRESLASDLIEPLRPRVDEWVWQRFVQRELREDGAQWLVDDAADPEEE